MIGRLRGVLVARSNGGVSIDVGGVGYEVTMTPRGLASMPGLGEEVVIHCHLHVREDEMTLYGFDAAADRDLFRVLLGASGVGPKVGMSMLATMDQSEIVAAVVGEDPDALTVVPGVGKRGAQKIILELAPKLAGRNADVLNKGTVAAVRQALENLGYSTDEINSAVREIDGELPIEEQLRIALQTLGRR